MSRPKMTPEQRAKMSETMKSRWAAINGAKANGTGLSVSTHIVLAIHGHELTLTANEARELLDMLTAIVPSTTAVEREAVA